MSRWNLAWFSLPPECEVQTSNVKGWEVKSTLQTVHGCGFPLSQQNKLKETMTMWLLGFMKNTPISRCTECFSSNEGSTELNSILIFWQYHLDDTPTEHPSNSVCLMSVWFKETCRYSDQETPAADCSHGDMFAKTHKHWSEEGCEIENPFQAKVRMMYLIMTFDRSREENGFLWG